MTVPESELARAARAVGRFAAVCLALASGCSTPAVTPATEPEAAAQPDAPIVMAQPGAWFDAQGGLTVVGAGRRLRLVLSAPIVACEPAFSQKASAEELAARASLPFYVLSDACRPEHPNILLAEESQTASPSELEQTYREVARCAAADLGATSGWIPDVVDKSDPCPAALGHGWRLPHVAELMGLTVDDRKAVAGALFESDSRAGFGSLLLYARGEGGQLTLVTLSPNASEQAPPLGESQRARPFFGAALRCVPPKGTAPQGKPASSPPLPFAQECLKSLRANQSALKLRPNAAPAPELQKLQAWIDGAERSPALVESEAALRELSQLLSTPTIERMAHDAREERALTEHYAQLAEGLDDPNVSAGERERRRAEFDTLRKRLGGQILQKAVSSGSDRLQLAALLAHLERTLQAQAQPDAGKKPAKQRRPNYGPLLSRLRELRGAKVSGP